MNRREFSAILAGVVGSLAVPRIGLPEPTVEPVEFLEPDSPDFVVSGWTTNEAAVMHDDVVLLPADGIEQLDIRQNMANVTSLNDPVETFMPAGRQYVDILYVTDEPVLELNEVITEGAKCRLEACGFRIDGFLSRVNVSVGDPRGRMVTEVEMVPTGKMEFDASYGPTGAGIWR